MLTPNELQDTISEVTVQHGDVYVTGYADNRPTGTLTELGQALKVQNPALLSLLVQEGQAAAYDRAPMLYPKCSAPSWIETNEARRVGHDIALLHDLPTSTKPTPAKPAVPQHDLHELFGPRSQAGKANDLAKANLPLYRSLREQAIEQGIVAAPGRDALRKVTPTI